MLDPLAILDQISLKLTCSGKSLIAVPNYKYIGQRVFGKDWVWFQQPYVHLWHFDPSNICLLFDKSNLRIDRLWTRDTWDAQIYDWSIKIGIDALKLLVGQRGKEWFLFEETMRLFTTLIYYILNPIHRLIGTGRELIVLAVKR